MAGSIGHGKGGRQDVRRPVCVEAVIAGQKTVLVRPRQLPHQDRADHGDDVADRDGEAANVLDLGADEGEDQLPHGGEDTRRDPEQSGVQSRVAQARDDDGREGDQAAVGDVLSHGENGERPRLGVGEALSYLVPLDLSVLDPRLVVLDADQADELFPVAQPVAGHGGIGEEEPNHHGPQHRKASQDEEEQAPGCDAGVGVSDAVADDAGKDGGALVEPESNSNRLLLVRPPHDGHDADDGEQHGLAHAHDEAAGGETTKVVGGGHAHHDDRPGETRTRQQLPHGELLYQYGARVLEGEIAKVEDGARPRILAAGEVGVLEHAVDGGIGNDDLVDGGQNDGGRHEREDDEVDFPEHLAGLLVTDGVVDDGPVQFGQEDGGDIGVTRIDHGIIATSDFDIAGLVHRLVRGIGIGRLFVGHFRSLE